MSAPRAAAALLAAAALAAAPPAAADHGASYEGRYANSFLSGVTADGRDVSVMAGTHEDFPYHDAGSRYDQLMVLVEGGEPVVVTGRPKLEGLALELGEESVRIGYAGPGLSLDLDLEAVRHTPRYEGDPAQVGDLFLEQGVQSDRSPGLVLTPYEIGALRRGTLTVRGRPIALAALHGQAEAGRIDAPADRRFRSAYDYVAAPTADPGGYTYLAFSTHALHPDGAPFDAYFRDTASDAFTMEAGRLSDGNPHGAPEPFRNTAEGGPALLGQWAVDLGPGILYRKLVRLADRDGRPLVVFSETIEEDTAPEPDTAPPALTDVRASAGRGGVRFGFRLSEDALVSVKAMGRWLEPRRTARAGANELELQGLRLRPGRRVLFLSAIDELGNRSAPAVLRLRAGRRR